MPINGKLILAGSASVQEDLAPVIGARRCRVSRPLKVAPDHRGEYGRGWRVDLEAIRKRMPPEIRQRDATVVYWLVEAPWSSEVVHSYVLVCVHLRFSFFTGPVTRYLGGATHEMRLVAVNPQADREQLLVGVRDAETLLRPDVFAAQFIAADDAAAAARVAHAVELVCGGRLSPHPTHVRSWVELFGDNMVRRAQAPAPEQAEGDQ